MVLVIILPPGLGLPKVNICPLLDLQFAPGRAAIPVRDLFAVYMEKISDDSFQQRSWGGGGGRHASQKRFVILKKCKGKGARCNFDLS